MAQPFALAGKEEEVKHLVELGFSWVDMGEHFNVNEKTVRRFFRKCILNTRTPKQPRVRIRKTEQELRELWDIALGVKYKKPQFNMIQN